ncbi:unnamed protein product [Boreogadus saida]
MMREIHHLERVQSLPAAPWLPALRAGVLLHGEDSHQASHLRATAPHLRAMKQSPEQLERREELDGVIACSFWIYRRAEREPEG